MNYKKLQTAAEELNEVLGLNPKIKTNLPQEKLEAKVVEAIGLIDPDTDTFTPDTQTVIDSFKEKPEEAAPEVEKPEAEETTEEVTKPTESLEEEIVSAKKLSELKEICKGNDEFKNLRGFLSSYKTDKELRKAMLGVLNVSKQIGQQTKSAAKPVEEKKAVEDKPKAAPKAFQKVTYSRGHALKEALEKGGTKEKLVELIDSFYEKHGGTANPKGAKAMLDIHLPILKIFEVVEEKNGSWKLISK